MVQAEQPPLTRRALHRAADVPAAPVRYDPPRRSLRTSGSRHKASSRPTAFPRVLELTKRLSFEAVAAATAVAFLAGAVTGVTLETTERQHRQDQTQAQAQRARAERAATVRLTAAAARYGQVRRAEALVVAESALVEAKAVLDSAPDLVGRATVDPLGAAVAELTALVAATDPTLLVEIDPDATLRPVADSDPGEDNTEAVRTATTPAGPVTTGSPGQADPAVPGPSTVPTTSSTAVATTTPTTPPVLPAVGSVDAGSAAPGAPATAADALTDPATAALSVAQIDGEVVDPAMSDALMAAAEQVAALSTQVAALRDKVAVELEAAADAAEARRAEEEAKRIAAEQAAIEAARARMSSRIAATNAAPNGQIPLDLLCRPRFTNVRLRCDAAQALEALNESYRAAFGRDLTVNGGYRTYAEQVQVREAKGDLAATPGTSNHGRGLAVDLSGFGGVGQFDDPDYLWMVENGPQFGWKHPPSMGPGGSGPLEPWHWEYGTF